MKNTIKILAALFYLTFISACIIGCKGEMGVPGTNGFDGSDGTDGTDGTDGQDGSANVYVDTFTVYETGNLNTGAEWNSTSFYYEYYRNNITAIDQSVVDGGAVLLYVESTNGWQTMPWAQVISSNTEIRSYTFAYSLNQLYINIEITDQSYPNIPWTYPDGGYRYKLIIIPPAQKLANPDIDWNNYEEVCDAFDLSR